MFEKGFIPAGKRLGKRRIVEVDVFGVHGSGFRDQGLGVRDQGSGGLL